MKEYKKIFKENNNVFKSKPFDIKKLSDAIYQFSQKNVEDGSYSKKIKGKSGENIEIASVAFYSISENE